MNNPSTVNVKTSHRNTARAITVTALLAAISYILAFLEFPVPLSPPFARMDLSDFPALIGAFAFGPVAGIIIELVKNVLSAFFHIYRGSGRTGKLFNGRGFCSYHRGADLQGVAH